MRIALFVHSLLSDWNHGNAHFLRGLVTELCARGHLVRVFEPVDAWSAVSLVAEAGEGALLRTRAVYPALDITRYRLGDVDERWLDAALVDWGADLTIVHEWNDHGLVAQIGRHRAERGDYALLFHDTHHRSVSDPGAMQAYDLSRYDGVLAFGSVIRDLYLVNRWARRAWVLHEAADVRVFSPMAADKSADVVWIGNWGDEERTRELGEFLIGPVQALGLAATVHGVRYPADARRRLDAARIDFGGWIANYDAPAAFARHRVTVHVPRRQYVTQLPGIPTIRPFEAMACAIPLVSAPWDDREALFRAGEDYLVARDGDEMRRHLRALVADPDLAAALAARGRATILSRHTCAHRAGELCAIARELGIDVDRAVGARTPAAMGGAA
jgi:spore maturation protein CgeB